jgi:hypothetical protein
LIELQNRFLIFFLNLIFFIFLNFFY